jgi:radical SAM superfamily enzyme YgiQ (UPF0313 family)
MKRFASQELHVSPEQIQIFTPTPSTYSSLMYYTGLDPFTLKPIYSEKDQTRKEQQKQIIVGNNETPVIKRTIKLLRGKKP